MGMGVVKVAVGVVDRHVLQKAPSSIVFMVLSHSPDAHHLVFLLFPICMMTTTTMTEPITLPLCAYARGYCTFRYMPDHNTL